MCDILSFYEICLAIDTENTKFQVCLPYAMIYDLTFAVHLSTLKPTILINDFIRDKNHIKW